METQKANKFKRQQASVCISFLIVTKHPQFIDSLCHEMRNPLNGLFGSFEVLRLSYCDTKEKEVEWALLKPECGVFIALALTLGYLLPYPITLILILCLLTYNFYVELQSFPKHGVWDMTQLLAEIKVR